MTDWSQYVGLPEKRLGRDRDGVDCFGLFRLVLREECGIEIPSYNGTYTCDAERRELEQLIGGGTQVGPWHPVQDIRPFDGLLFRMCGHSSHIGIAIDARRMLHVHGGRSVIEPLSHPRWRSRRAGVWRHEGLIA